MKSKSNDSKNKSLKEQAQSLTQAFKPSNRSSKGPTATLQIEPLECSSP